MTTTATDTNIHESMPDGRWEFNDEVTATFDNMLERSIPQYHTMRRTVFEIGRRFASEAGGPRLLDLGCSRGEAIAPFAEDGWDAVGLEVSEPMLEAARDRFSGAVGVQVARHDLREALPLSVGTPDLILSVLTLQFVPINYRQRILSDCARLLRTGGGMILVEKVLGNGAAIDGLLVDVYHDAKQQAGYSAEEVERKRLALEGVLVPVTAEMNEMLLRRAGFSEVDCFWRWSNFAAWIAVR